MTTEVVQPATLPIMSHWIDGRPVEVLPEQTGPVYNPATGQVIGRVPRGGASEVDAAVVAARAAFPAWRDTPLIARSQVFFAYRELVWRHREEMAALITRDHGKTFPDALGEVLRGSTVAQQKGEMGRLAVERLVQALDEPGLNREPEIIRLPMTLMVRESAGPPPAVAGGTVA